MTKKMSEIINTQKCYVCGKENLSKNEIGLTKKLLSKRSKIFYCIDCLSDYLDVDKDFLIEKIEEFKAQGCDLF